MPQVNFIFDSNSNAIAEIIRAKGNRAPEAWRKASSHLAELWLLNVKQLSAVQYASLRQLARMGHPYARGHFARGTGSKTVEQNSRLMARAALPAEAYNINKQSGKLFAGWESNVVNRGNEIAIQISNREPYFKYLNYGTRFMISRPIIQVALARASKQFPDVYTEAEMTIHGYKQ